MKLKDVIRKAWDTLPQSVRFCALDAGSGFSGEYQVNGKHTTYCAYGKSCPLQNNDSDYGVMKCDYKPLYDLLEKKVE